MAGRVGLKQTIYHLLWKMPTGFWTGFYRLTGFVFVWEGNSQFAIPEKQPGSFKPPYGTGEYAFRFEGPSLIAYLGMYFVAALASVAACIYAMGILSGIALANRGKHP